LATGEKPLTTNILEISPHRVYLVSLQHYLYILSVALVLAQLLEMTGVTRYASLWCPDFPLQYKIGTIRRSAFAKVVFFWSQSRYPLQSFLRRKKIALKKDFHYYRGYDTSIQNNFFVKLNLNFEFEIIKSIFANQ
jgi:hypothetical protein